MLAFLEIKCGPKGVKYIVSSKMINLSYEAPKVEIIFVEAQHCFAASSEYVSSPKGLNDLEEVGADWN